MEFNIAVFVELYCIYLVSTSTPSKSNIELQFLDNRQQF